MKGVKGLPLIVMVIMVILSFANLFGLNISGASVILGVVFFFVNKAMEKETASESGLDIKAIGRDLKDKKIWIWILLPLVMHGFWVLMSKLFMPEYIEYEIARAGEFVSVQVGIVAALQFLFFALGEEIAWRAFFQRQLNKALPIMQVLLISSALFALGHFKVGSVGVVAFSMISVFINSVLYGVVFHKTNNAWISTISHFVANMFEVILFVCL